MIPSRSGLLVLCGLLMVQTGVPRLSSPSPSTPKPRIPAQPWTRPGDAAGEYRERLLAQERLGMRFMDLDRHKDALAAFTQALALTGSLEDRQAEARLLSHAGLMHFYLGDHSRARALSQRGLDLARTERDLAVQASALNNLAMISRSQGQIQEALESYRISLKLWNELGEHAEEARVLSNRGELYLTLGQHELALDSFHRGLALLRLEDKKDVRLWLLVGAALAQHETGFPRRAIQTYRLALPLARTDRRRGLILWRMALAHRDAGRLDRAASLLQESRRLARLYGGPRPEAYALADLAHIEDLRGREDEAVRRFNQALEIVRGLGEPTVRASILFGRAEAERDRGRLDEAIASVEESIRLVESVRSDLGPGQRVPFFAARHRYYELYVALLMDEHRRDPAGGHEVRAFEAGERSRARSLLDEMAGRPGAAVMPLDQIQREVLDDESLLLAYQFGEPRSTLWVVSPTSVAAVDLPSRGKIEAEARGTWQRLSEGGSEVETLSGMLFPAALGPLGRKRLLIVADGVLHRIPFAALCDPNLPRGGCRSRAPLVLDHELVRLPSASVLGRMRQKPASGGPAPGAIGMLADPVFQRGDPRLVNRIGEPRPEEREPESGLGVERLERLRFTNEEAKKILRLFRTGSFSALGFSASREAAISPAFLRNRILHFATHNVVSEHPDLSGLVLSRFDEQGRPVDGFLGVREIYDLSLAADLVVLSACGTGLGREVRGEGVIGLARAFLHAGAKRVVVSLWDVREGETTELMTRFYRHLREGRSAAAALRSAQASMASEGLPPRSWAGFVLQGEPR